MLVKYEGGQDDLSSSEEKPFIGRYHSVLRQRKNDPRQLSKKNKPQYKKKRFSLKGPLWMHQVWKIETPLAHNHVYNFHNILAINEHSLLDPGCEESFVSSKFYMKKVSTVTIKRDCLFFSLSNVPFETTPIPYLCEKLRSMGDAEYYRFAQTVEHAEETLSAIAQKPNTQDTLDELKLDQFLDEMASRHFFSQYSPHLLIISNSFLQLLGYSWEELAIESIKHKTILQEFFSAEHYSQIIHKHLQNIRMMKDYIEGKMTLDEFCSQSMIVCQDYIYTRSNKKIKCNFFGGTSKQLTPYIQIREPGLIEEEVQTDSTRLIAQKQKIEQFKQSYKAKEFDLLRKLVTIPKHEDPLFENKICSYKALTTHSVHSSESSQ